MRQHAFSSRRGVDSNGPSAVLRCQNVIANRKTRFSSSQRVFAASTSAFSRRRRFSRRTQSVVSRKPVCISRREFVVCNWERRSLRRAASRTRIKASLFVGKAFLSRWKSVPDDCSSVTSHGKDVSSHWASSSFKRSSVLLSSRSKSSRAVSAPCFEEYDVSHRPAVPNRSNRCVERSWTRPDSNGRRGS